MQPLRVCRGQRVLSTSVAVLYALGHLTARVRTLVRAATLGAGVATPDRLSVDLGGHHRVHTLRAIRYVKRERVAVQS